MSHYGRAVVPGPGLLPIAGRVRLDHKTKALARRIRPGEIAVVDHEDLDETAARSLVKAGVRAVVNVRPFLSGRLSTLGPRILMDAGVLLVETDGPAVFELAEGDRVRFDGHALWSGDRFVSLGRLLTREDIAGKLREAQVRMKEQLARFVGNTLAYAEAEKDLILNPLRLPALRTTIKGRQVLVVVRGQDHQRDLRAIRPYIRDVKPVLIGVDGGADALLESGLTPHIIVGDMDSVSDRALRSGAEILVHAYPDGRAPGLERVQKLGLQAWAIPAPGTSEDLALLLAFEQGADLIVAVGTHISMVEFMEKGRPGMASTLLTRIKVGGILVDAKGVSRLYQKGVTWSQLAVLIVAGLLTMGLVFLSSPSTQNLGRLLWIKIRYTLGL